MVLKTKETAVSAGNVKVRKTKVSLMLFSGDDARAAPRRHRAFTAPTPASGGTPRLPSPRGGCPRPGEGEFDPDETRSRLVWPHWPETTKRRARGGETLPRPAPAGDRFRR